MPHIRVNCLTGALTPPKKAKLAAALVEIVMGQEIEPMTEIGRAATPVMFSEIDAHNWFPGGQPLVEHPQKTFFIVEAVVAASFFSQPRRDALQTAVAKVWHASASHERVRTIAELRKANPRNTSGVSR